MKIIRSREELQAALAVLPRPLGFVPTMGYFHEGHLSLMRASRRENRSTVVSLYVNPLQFGPQEDLARYPRDAERDRLLAEREGVDLLFTPDDEEMYPSVGRIPGSLQRTRVQVEGLSSIWEGASRPGHFEGVATVVVKLFHLVQPDTAYFGQKDYQQALVIQTLVRDLALPVTIRVLPTVREADGLALSSRNAYLSPQERQAAPRLYQSLRLGEELIRQGERDPQAVIWQMESFLSKEPLCRLDYVTVVAPETLLVPAAIRLPVALLGAAWFGKARLIDNLIVR
ncbi:MAG: pantoate--beta-alanine ligase [Bacillota bacterium]|nr:pantoate--beta-alanine ligase [Bacillota bacterium]